MFTVNDIGKNYKKKMKGNASSKKAYVLQGKKLPLNAIAVTHEIINLQQLKEKAKENRSDDYTIFNCCFML